MFDALIFDMDGTLVDNVDIITKAWTIICKNNNYDVSIDNNTIRNCMGLTHEEIAKIIFPNVDEKIAIEHIKKCIKDEVSYLNKNMGKSYVDEDTLNILSKKYKLFIVSNCLEGYIESYLNYYNFNKYFIETLNSSNNKTKGENIKYLVDKYNLKNPAYIGDTIKDKQASDFANVHFIHAAYGFGIVDCKDKIYDIKELLKNSD